MVEHDHDLLGRKDLCATHLAQEVGGARRAAIVEHDVIGDNVDDFTDLDAPAVGVLGNDFSK